MTEPKTITEDEAERAATIEMLRKFADKLEADPGLQASVSIEYDNGRGAVGSMRLRAS